MSDTMLLGVLRMPFDLAMATLTAQIQYHQRGVQAADEIERLTRERDEARAEVERMREELPVAASLKIKAECAEIERNEARAVVWRQAKEITDLRAEVERLRAENEKLRDQNKLFRGALDFVAAYRALDFDPQKNLAASHMSIVAREALEAKP